MTYEKPVIYVEDLSTIVNSDIYNHCYTGC